MMIRPLHNDIQTPLRRASTPATAVDLWIATRLKQEYAGIVAEPLPAALMDLLQDV